MPGRQAVNCSGLNAKILAALRLLERQAMTLYAVLALRTVSFIFIGCKQGEILSIFRNIYFQSSGAHNIVAYIRKCLYSNAFKGFSTHLEDHIQITAFETYPFTAGEGAVAFLAVE